MRISFLLLFFILTSTLSGWAQTDRKMVEVRDGIYRATSGNYHSLVWVTSDGIAVVDPINKETAQWLKNEWTPDSISRCVISSTVITTRIILWVEMFSTILARSW